VDRSSAKRRTAGFWVSAWLPVALAIGVIAAESTVYFGADRTSAPLRWLFQHLFWRVSDERWAVLHHLIRKSGHFVGYGMVALTWLRAWWMTLPKSGFLKDAFLALVSTAIVATSDEFHQKFLPNRGSSPWDVLLDCCGAVAMQLLVFFFLRLFRPGQLARAA
jgi:VanZ family protein